MMSIVTIGFGLGIAFGPLMAGAFAIISYRLPFLVVGGLCLAGTVVVYFFMGETIERKLPKRRYSGWTGNESEGYPGSIHPRLWPAAVVEISGFEPDEFKY
jgi:MFS family permease